MVWKVEQCKMMFRTAEDWLKTKSKGVTVLCIVRQLL